MRPPARIEPLKGKPRFDQMCFTARSRKTTQQATATSETVVCLVAGHFHYFLLARVLSNKVDNAIIETKLDSVSLGKDQGIPLSSVFSRLKSHLIYIVHIENDTEFPLAKPTMHNSFIDQS